MDRLCILYSVTRASFHALYHRDARRARTRFVSMMCIGMRSAYYVNKKKKLVDTAGQKIATERAVPCSHHIEEKRFKKTHLTFLPITRKLETVESREKNCQIAQGG